MAYQETTTTGYGKRVGNSFRGILPGLLLFLAGTALLWWNEGRAVKTDKMLKEAEDVTVEMENIDRVDPQFDGKLVYATGMTAKQVKNNLYVARQNIRERLKKIGYE